MRAYQPLAAAFFASLLVAACGGGGGGSPDVDTELPQATLTAPVALSAGLANTITLSATATDNVGVASVEFQVDGNSLGTPDVTAPYSQTLDTTQYASGQHVLRARARDAAGNLSAWSSATMQFGGTRNAPAGFTNGVFAGGLTNATAIAQEALPSGRFFIAEQGGALRVVKNGVLLATPFIALTVDSTVERGLIGVTLHPDFANNRFIYLHYTTPEGGTHNRISRFTANPQNPDIVSVGSELRIADLPLLGSATNHNGGALHFGADGKLYVAVGDNTDSAKAADLNDPFGKMLRFNDDGSIPSDNPFCTTAATLRCAIWARGLRNPYTFAVQPGTNGRIHINDVGEGTWEEINLGVRAANYGWPATEGPTTAAGVTAPLFAYGHSVTTPPGQGAGGFFTGCAISGGAFYPDAGPFPPGYRNSYYFADFCGRFIGRIDLGGGGASAFGTVTSNPVDMVTGADGALYVLTRSSIVRFGAP
jgi:glucose/arabinose dehydrogenase